MRITSQLLQACTSVTVEKAEYIDLSGKDIVVIERLFICQRLRTLILSNNSIKEIQNVDCCRQLWNLDISGNKLKSLCGLSRFPVLGSVCLGGNELDWQELHHISHITILNLSLLGNPKMDSNSHYRQHVVDILPNVWMLDGRLITAKERKQVEDFFNESQSSLHPVRRKTSESVFIPSSLKNLLVNGIFGEKTTHMMSRFPISYIHNTDMDKKRLSYLIYSIEDDMILSQLHRDITPNTSPTHSTSSKQPSESCTLRSTHQTPHLQSLFEHREKEMEQCNMLLLLMLAALEYSIPSDVMHATLETAKIITIGDVQCADLFLLPRKLLLDIASLLLSAATVDRLEKQEGGLYNQLYKSLCFTMETVQKKLRCSTRKMVAAKKTKLFGDSKTHHTWRCLLASEVIHLMCLVPHFFDSLQTNEGLTKMTAVATRNPDVSAMIASIIWKVQDKGGNVWEIYQDIASYLLQATSDNVLGKRKGRSTLRPNVHRTTSQLLHPTQPKLSPRLLRAMSAGVARKAVSRRAPKSATFSRGGIKEPELGDTVIINAEQVARIVALPESKTAVLHINSTPSINYTDAYFYTDTNGLVWDQQYKCWIRDSLAGDLSTSYLSDSVSCAAIPTLASITSLNEIATPRPTTPEHGLHHFSRPQSGMSFRSDDLQTILSQEELLDDTYLERPSSSNSSPRGIQLSPLKVDFGSSAPSSTSILSENDHQKHVLQQYSINQLMTDNRDSLGLKSPSREHKASIKNDSVIQLSPRSQALQDLRRSTWDAKETEVKHASENDGFTVPTPQLQLAETWDSEKSVPSILLRHFKPHSCKVIELDKQNLRVEPHMPPSPVVSTSPRTLSPSSYTVLDDTESVFHPAFERPAVLYNAWTMAKPNASTKHSLLTSSRLMQKRQPKTPPVTRQSNQLCSGQSGLGSYAILRTKQQKQQQTQLVQQRMGGYNSHAGKVAGKYHYFQPKPGKMSGGTSIRKLGKTKVVPDLYIMGSK